MGINYNVTPAEVYLIAQTLGVISEDYQKEVKKIYDSLEYLNSNWKGMGATTYYSDITNLRQEIEALGQVIGQYASFSGTSAKIYDQTDKGIAEASNSNFKIENL